MMFSLKPKRIIAVISICALILSLASCTASKDKVAASLGEYDNHVFFTSGGFQDYTDYAKYYYTSTQVAENQYLKEIKDTDLETINTHLDNFEGWIETIKSSDASNEVVVNYDFDRKIIDTEDYFFIESEERTLDGHTSLVKYNIYLFDTQTQVLYYFHNNT